MRGRSMLKALALAGILLGFAGAPSARAQDWSDYLHWPYTPPQVPGNGFQHQPLYDRWYLYPRDMRIKPQIQGPYYYNYYASTDPYGAAPTDTLRVRLWNSTGAAVNGYFSITVTC